MADSTSLIDGSRDPGTSFAGKMDELWRSVVAARKELFSVIDAAQAAGGKDE